MTEAILGDVPDDPGFIKFYGLYWRKDKMNVDNVQMLGSPRGWTGKGLTQGDAADRQMNFWGQKGVYVLYDAGLQPVYAGQAGLIRKADAVGQSIGSRIASHANGVYRNGWALFSWFGFMHTPKINLRTASDVERLNPQWSFVPGKQQELNQLLASFEAILIEGFAPRFNARGGDLGKAVFVNQFED
jgi:hypothetical protein